MKSKTTARHNIKRVARYLANPRIKATDALFYLQKKLFNTNKRLIIAIDWTTIEPYQMLKATVCGKGRGILFAYKVVREGEIKEIP